MFQRAIRSDAERLKSRWPEDHGEVETMYSLAENLVTCWEDLHNEFKSTNTLQNEELLCAMMYQSWELCDETFSKWDEANPIALPARKKIAHCGCQTAVPYLRTPLEW